MTALPLTMLLSTRNTPITAPSIEEIEYLLSMRHGSVENHQMHLRQGSIWHSFQRTICVVIELNYEHVSKDFGHGLQLQHIVERFQKNYTHVMGFANI